MSWFGKKMRELPTASFEKKREKKITLHDFITLKNRSQDVERSLFSGQKSGSSEILFL